MDDNLNKNYKIFEAAPQEVRGLPAKKQIPDYFLWWITSFSFCVFIFFFQLLQTLHGRLGVDRRGGV
jgi:hypothetical protein